MTADRCPGVLRPHLAADGAMVRIRIPGGQTTGTALDQLGVLAQTFGSGLLQLTSRAGVQLRGLPEVLPPAVETGIAAAGLLPSASHERVRNIVGSPLTGLAGTHGPAGAVGADAARADLRAMVGELDRALLAAPALAELPGRFLFGLDDGRGDILALGPDLAYHALDARSGLVVVGGTHALKVRARAAVAALIDLAHRFQSQRPVGAWRAADRPGWVAGLGLAAAPSPPTAPPQPLGAVAGHASVGVPLGYLTPEQLSVVVQLAGAGPVVVTPWRGLVIPDAAAGLDRLTAVGLVADAGSPWTALSGCVGAPWCASGRVDTQALVRAAAQLAGPWPRTHISGCERRCGAPSGPHVDLVAPRLEDVRALVEEPVHV